MALETVEVKGSGTSREDGRIKYYWRVFVSTDGTTDVPAFGTLLVADAALGAPGRRVEDIQKDLDTVPSRYLITIRYKGFVPYA